MINAISYRKQPVWLSQLTPQSIQTDPAPLKKLLRSSLYYPACGLDYFPVERFLGNFYSFVYVDYGVTKNELIESIHRLQFKGYDLLSYRELDDEELSLNSWDSKYIDKRELEYLNPQDTFAIWAVFEYYPKGGNLKRFSLLFLNHDGIIAYDNLYLKNSLSPGMLAIIQPGYGFGGNWTNFEDRYELLAHLVLDDSIKIPRYITFGGDFDCDNYLKPCWPEYDRQVAIIRKPDDGGCISVWETLHPKIVK